MRGYIPAGLDPPMTRAFGEIWRAISKQQDVSIVNLKGKKFTGAGSAANQDEFVTLGQMQSAVDSVDRGGGSSTVTFLSQTNTVVSGGPWQRVGSNSILIYPNDGVIIGSYTPITDAILQIVQGTTPGRDGIYLFSGFYFRYGINMSVTQMGSAAIFLRSGDINGRIAWDNGPYLTSNIDLVELGNTNGNGLTFRRAGPVGSYLEEGTSIEEVTLSTTGATTLSVAMLLPANSIIEFVTYRITEEIAGGGVTGLQVGDAALATRFSAGIASLLLGATDTLHRQWDTNINALAGGVGPRQNAARQMQFTALGGSTIPTQGKIKIVVFWKRASAPTS